MNTILAYRTAVRRVAPRFVIPGRLFNVLSANKSSKRWYAQSWDNKQPNKDVDAHIKVQQLLSDIQSHPNVLEKLNNISELMMSKGLANESAPPGPWQVIKILTDKEMRVAMSQFKEELQKSGIEIGPDQLGPLMTVLGMDKK
ncbi:LAFE_0D01970g1_1 [Lachancea fermentati]|uniref:LAFE_0D01970g1_1 n=1 Tax=Lachancea fermentati TaxID=4955 RepID=A0A1G4MB33_LACFM|nr:LAFE_0D01970g1_1 [Lachancea fermentati]